MTDPHKLAKRIVFHVDRDFECVGIVERILREELEGGGATVGDSIPGLTLSGGEQEVRRSGATEPSAPAAPDPHEYLELNGRCVHWVPSPLDGGASATHCGRPADDPIHAQNSPQRHRPLPLRRFIGRRAYNRRILARKPMRP